MKYHWTNKSSTWVPDKVASSRVWRRRRGQSTSAFSAAAATMLAIFFISVVHSVCHLYSAPVHLVHRQQTSADSVHCAIIILRERPICTGACCSFIHYLAINTAELLNEIFLQSSVVVVLYVESRATWTARGPRNIRCQPSTLCHVQVRCCLGDR